MNIMSKLKSCPFCGGEVRFVAGPLIGLSMISCPKCGACVSFHGKEKSKKTIRAWNRRKEKKC